MTDGVHIEAATRGVLCKKVFLEISQNSQGNTCARVSFLIKLQSLQALACNFIKKRFRHKCFPLHFAKFLRTPFYMTLVDDCFYAQELCNCENLQRCQ